MTNLPQGRRKCVAVPAAGLALAAALLVVADRAVAQQPPVPTIPETVVEARQRPRRWLRRPTRSERQAR